MNEQTNEERLRLEALEAREQALADKERRHYAAQEVKRRGLPEGLLEALDHSSDQALEKGLALADRLFALARMAGAGDGAPRLSRPAVADISKLSYTERAALYLADREGYQEITGGKH